MSFAWPLGLPNACGGCPQVVLTIFICEFKVFATSSSSFTSRHFSFNVTTSSFLAFLFVRNGDIESQKLLLVKGCFSADFGKHCLLAVFFRFVHLLFICFRAKKFYMDGHLLYLLLILDLVITALLSSFVMKGAWSYIIWWNFSKYLQLRRKKKQRRSRGWGSTVRSMACS